MAHQAARLCHLGDPVRPFLAGIAVTVLSTYFYLTHGVRMLDTTWRERDRLSPHWGVYQIGVLSPILRVFFPQSDELLTLKTELQSAGMHGFFPTVWAAAYIDFGMVGAVIYILIWGFAAGWSAFGVRHSVLVTPALLLTFVIASILLSPVQGPLGIANSALVLVSIIIVGLAADFGGREQSAAKPAAARPQSGRRAPAAAGRIRRRYSAKPGRGFRNALLHGVGQRSADRLGRRRVEAILRQHVVEAERIERKASDADRVHGVTATGQRAREPDRHMADRRHLERALKRIAPRHADRSARSRRDRKSCDG